MGIALTINEKLNCCCACCCNVLYATVEALKVINVYTKVRMTCISCHISSYPGVFLIRMLFECIAHRGLIEFLL